MSDDGSSGGLYNRESSPDPGGSQYNDSGSKKGLAEGSKEEEPVKVGFGFNTRNVTDQ